MSTSTGAKLKALTSYTAWTLGAQIAITLMQFAYATVTSRLVPDSGFGAFAVALSLSTLVTLIAQGGLGQAVARAPELHPGKLSFLVLFAVGLGIIAALLLVALAAPWAALWNSPEAVAPSLVIGVASFVAPLSGLLMGVLRRLGQFRSLALLASTTSGAGMGVGLIAVILAPGPVTLLVSPVVASILLTILALVLTRGSWWARPEVNMARADLDFAWRVLGLSMLSYLNGGAAGWSLSRWVGTDSLGQLNRANVLTQVPIEQALGALTRAVYPEFRHDIGVQSRTKQAWTDYLLVTSWVAFPFAALLAGAAPIAIAMLFGPGWGLASAMAPLVAIRSGLAAIDTALAGALEAVGRFRLLAWTTFVSLSVIAAGAVVTAMTGSWLGALLGILAGTLVRHLLNVTFAARLGALDWFSLAKGYVWALATSVVLGGAAALVSSSALGSRSPATGFIGAGILATVLVTCMAKWRSLPPTRILSRYR